MNTLRGNRAAKQSMQNNLYSMQSNIPIYNFIMIQNAYSKESRTWLRLNYSFLSTEVWIYFLPPPPSAPNLKNINLMGSPACHPRGFPPASSWTWICMSALLPSVGVHTPTTGRPTFLFSPLNLAFYSLFDILFSIVFWVWPSFSLALHLLVSAETLPK